MMRAHQQNEEDIKLYNKNTQQHNRATKKELVWLCRTLKPLTENFDKLPYMEMSLSSTERSGT